MEFYATPEDIFEGRISDVYFERTNRILKERGVHRKVFAEVTAKSLPENWPWAMLSGVEECAELLSRLPVEARALPEGSVFHPREPVLTVEGYYEDFGAYETAILGFLCQASGVTTAAARCRLAAGERMLLSFGARRAHPLLVPMVERCAYVAGCDGVSTVRAAELLGIEPSGTIPHSLVLLLGSATEALRAFDEVIERKFPRVALVDTFGDEKFESLEAAAALENPPAAVRLDTPASRRGDFGEILREVRWELDTHGYGGVGIFVSGGIDEEAILELNDFAAGYGVGTRIAGAPPVDFALDIVEIDGDAIAKRGKESGRKDLLRCESCRRRIIVPAETEERLCECGGRFDELLEPLVSGGERAAAAPQLADIRTHAASEIAGLGLSIC